MFSCLLCISPVSLLRSSEGAYLTESQIREIFTKHVQVNYTEEYKNRHLRLPRMKKTGSWSWEGKDFSRVIALLEFERFISEKQIFAHKALAIEGYYADAGYDPECFLLPHDRLDVTTYQTNPAEHDLHNLILDQHDYDFVMANQVLEHVYDPIRCLKNIHKHMRVGGILYINVPANNLPHEITYHYYTGFTPLGLGSVVQAAGFEILSIGQWGNYEYLNLLFQTYGWPDYRALKNPGLNDIRHPVITWIFAVKRGEI